MTNFTRPLCSAAALALAAAIPGVAFAGQFGEAGENNDVLRARFNTFYGPTGLITVPDAFTPSKGRVVLGTAFSENRSVTLNYALVDDVEIGGAFVDRENADNEVLGNAKISIVPANWKGFRLGFGVIDAVDAIDQTAYGVASWEYLPPDFLTEQGVVGVRLHAGYGTGMFSEDIIGGGEFMFGPKISVVGEWNGTDFNAALRYVRDENLRLQAGFIGDKLYFGTSYAFNF